MNGPPTPALHRSLRSVTLLLALLTAGIGALYSQTPCVELSQPGDTHRVALPGTIVNLGIRVANHSAEERTFAARLDLPRGWKALFSLPTIVLPAQAADVRVVSFSIPTTCQTGSYTLRYSVQSDTPSPCSGELLIELQVLPRHQIDLRLLEAPRYAIAGDMFVTFFVVTNLGNEPGYVTLSTRSIEDVIAIPDSSLVWLAPSENREVRVEVTTNPSLLQNVPVVVELRAKLSADSLVTKSASCTVELLPRAGAGGPRYHDIPGSATIRGAGEDNMVGTQIELQGSGKLVPAGQNHLDFLVRTPDVQNQSLFAYRDEYRFNYSSEDVDVYVGDRSYSLSPLTEFARYGFGLGGSAKIGKFTVGGFYNETRFYYPRQKEGAAFVAYDVLDKQTLALNFLRKPDVTNSSIMSVRGILHPIPRTTLDVELGTSTQGDVTDQAWAARLVGAEGWIYYDLRYVRAHPNFAGYYRNLDFKSATATARPWKELRLELYGLDQRSDPVYPFVVEPRNQLLQAGIGWGEWGTVYYRVSSLYDEFIVPKFSRREESVEVRGGYTWPHIAVSAIVNAGTSRDVLLARQGPFRRYLLSSSVAVGDYQSYVATAEYSQDPNLFTNEQLERWSGSIGAFVSVGAFTHLQAGIYGTRNIAPTNESSVFIDLGLEHVLPFKHTISLRGRQSIYTPVSVANAVSYLLEYTVPFALPISQIDSTGELRGTITDALTTKGVPNVVVLAGDAAVITDATGQFTFPALAPGTYQFMLDLGSIGADRVTAEPMPYPVVVGGGKISRLAVRLIAGGSVKGSVQRYGFPEQAGGDSSTTTVEAGGIGNILVELVGASETLRKLTDSRGTFQFTNVRPHEWTLRIDDSELPANHYVQQGSETFQLEPGGEHSTVFRVLPRKKKIQVVQEGVVQVVAPPSEQQAPIQFGKCVIRRDAKTGLYIVEVSRWKTKKEATQEVRRLQRDAGLKAMVRRESTNEYRVQFEKIASLTEAEAMCMRGTR